jgi:hypothetical protein
MNAETAENTEDTEKAAKEKGFEAENAADTEETEEAKPLQQLQAAARLSFAEALSADNCGAGEAGNARRAAAPGVMAAEGEEAGAGDSAEDGVGAFA